MRKYFLISAVALLAATSANATTDYAEVTARATIEVATTMDCTDVDFGTIVVKQNNAASTVTMDADMGKVYGDGDILSIDSDETFFSCNNGDGMPITGIDLSFPSSIVLSNGNGGEMTVDFSINGAESIDAVLHIPAKVQSGDYTETFTVTYTY